MPQAESHHTPIPSRRDVMRGSGKVTVTLAVLARAATAAVPAPAASIVGDDDEIIALGREIDRLVAAGDAIPDDDAAWVEFAKTIPLSFPIADLRATTMPALAVKLRLAANPREGHDISEFPMRNLVSARDDAMRMAEGQA